MEGSQQAERAQGRPSDGATTERVAQAAQLFANLTQPGERPRNGDQPQPAGDPDTYERLPDNHPGTSERLPDNHEVLELLQAALAANERTEKTVELLRNDLNMTIANVELLRAAPAAALLVPADPAADERIEKTAELLRNDLNTTISNVTVLHTAMTKALRFLNKRVDALERERPG